MGRVKTICYANLNDFNCPKGVTDDHMRSFFKHHLENTVLEIVDVVIDRYSELTFISSREGWKKVIHLANEEQVKMIFVPSISMLAYSLMGAINIIRQQKLDFGIDFGFAYEALHTEEQSAEMALQFHALLLEHKEKLKRNENRMRAEFLKATGITGEPSAIAVRIESDLYELGQQKAHEYGLNVEDIIHEFLRDVTNPKNAEAFDLYMNGSAVDQTN